MPFTPEYFTAAEFRALPNMGEAKYTDDRAQAAADAVVATIERVVGTSFVPRARTFTASGGGTTVVLPHAYVVALTAVTVGGVAQTLGDLYVEAGMVGFTDGRSFASGTRNVVVSYTSGYSSTPPDDIKEAALFATRARLIETNSNALMNDRRTSQSMPEGGSTSFGLPTPDRPFGYPTVDAVVAGWADELRVFGFA